MAELTYSTKLDIRYDVDVFIAGGGPSGVAAAVAAARQGASVFIAESFGAFGGAATTMLVPAYMTFGNGPFLAAGIGSEIYNYIKENAPGSYKKYCPMSIPVETLKLCCDKLVTDSGAKFLFHTTLIDVIVEAGTIKYAICASKGSNFAVKAKVFIDCTGDADMSAFAGAEYEFGDEQGRVMATTLCGIWAGINWDETFGPDSRELDRAFADGIFTNEDRHLPGIWKLADGVGGSNAGHVYDVDGGDAASLTEGIMKGRRQLLEYRRYFREYLNGYENAELVWSGAYLGIREGRRVTCEYRLVIDDFRRQAVFDDEIGRYCYNIDIHSPTNDKEGYETFIKDHTTLRYKKGESYGIPYRTLTAKGFTNLLVAGRAICTDRYMQSSVRVMPGCYITGQAAGIAAHLAASGRTAVNAIDVHELQARLVKLGAYLPNFKA